MLKHHLWRIRKSFANPHQVNPQYKKLDIHVQQQSTNIINTVGYLIFAVVLSDYALLWVSAQFSSSTWIHSAAGEFVENGWGFLLGILLIFYRRDRDIVKPKEFLFLKLVSWLTLIAGIGYFLIAPSIIANAFRINHTNQTQMVGQMNLAKSQLQEYAKQLEQVNPKQLEEMLKVYQQQAPELRINSQQQLKENLLSQAQQQQAQIQAELQTKFNSQKKTLFKTTAKWSMIGIVTGMCSLLIWKYTTWARVKY